MYYCSANRKYNNHSIYTALCSADVSKLIEEGIKFDLAFLDISLENEKGTDIANYLAGNQSNIKIVFISGYPEMVSDVFFSVRPFGFIDKPIKSDKLYKYIEAAQKEINEAVNHFCCKIRGTDIGIVYDTIVYVCSENKNLIVHRVDGTVVKAAGLLEDAINKLPDFFFRCHKGYIVNLKFATGYSHSEVSMMGGDVIPVSRTRKEEFEKAYFTFKGVI